MAKKKRKFEVGTKVKIKSAMSDSDKIEEIFDIFEES